MENCCRYTGLTVHQISASTPSASWTTLTAPPAGNSFIIASRLEPESG